MRTASSLTHTHSQRARILPALAALMNHPARLVALDQARAALAFGNRLVKRLEHPQQPRLSVGQRARRNRDPIVASARATARNGR